MNKNILYAVVIAGVITVGGWWFFGQGGFTQAPVVDNDVVVEESEEVVPDAPAVVTLVTYSDSGFFPKEITFAPQGITVEFKNESNRLFWPASAMHPTHTVYPGSDIEKCGTEEESSLFDACRPVASGESYFFTFNEPGEWGYHDHLNSSFFGKISVVVVE